MWLWSSQNTAHDGEDEDNGTVSMGKPCGQRDHPNWRNNQTATGSATKFMRLGKSQYFPESKHKIN